MDQITDVVIALYDAGASLGLTGWMILASLVAAVAKLTGRKAATGRRS